MLRLPRRRKGLAVTCHPLAGMPQQCGSFKIPQERLLFFWRPEEEAETVLFLSAIKTAPVDQGIVGVAGALYRKWHPGYGMDANDAILAATVMQTGGRIYTLNVIHFPMADINVRRGWT